MAKKNGKRSAAGGGTIRKKTMTNKKTGAVYSYWEARVTIGYDSKTGKQIQKSFSGKTQKEVREKMQAAAVEVNQGTYKEPSKMTLGEWLDIWEKEYLGRVSTMTKLNYCQHSKNHIRPALGKIKLEKLDGPMIQRFYNDLATPHGDIPRLSGKTVKCIHGVLHKALSQACKVGYIRSNPSESCELPRAERKEIKPLDSKEIAAFLAAIKGHRFEVLYLVTLACGLRRAEVCGLLWGDGVDLESGTITINKQLQNIPGKPGEFHLVPTKNRKSRTIALAPTVVDALKKHKINQAIDRLKTGEAWEDSGFVFTNELGHHVSPNTVYHNFKRIAASIGLPEARLHDLRHSYATEMMRSGASIKSIQDTLGHHSSAFTTDTYIGVTDELKKDAAEKMEGIIQKASGK